MNWMERDQKAIMSTYQRLPIAVDKGEGNYLFDTEGKAYLDLFTGLAVNLLGHSHPYLLKKLAEQSQKFLHISNIFLNQPAIELAERMLEHSIPGKVFFANSGAEATEAAVKLVHKWKKEQSEEKNGIVVLEKSFHGRTLGVVKLTRQPGIYQDFPAADYPVFETTPEDLDQLESVLIKEKPAAFMAEPILGSGGITPLSKAYLQGAEALCKKYNVLFCIDEIQTGIGRTGTFFAYQQSDVVPDMILFAKGIGGGLPLGGVIAGEKLKDKFAPGDHGTTFGPSPLSAALGNAVMDVLFEQNGLKEGRKQAVYFRQRLEALQLELKTDIQEIRGMGMMLGVKLDADADKVKSIQESLLHRGYMVNIAQQTIIRLLPPLTLQNEEADSFIQAFKEELISRRQEASV